MSYLLSMEKFNLSDLIKLFEIYSFTYTAQSLLQLDRFMDGEADGKIPVYFCLIWEKIGQNRPCVTDGWDKLKSKLSNLFPHQITLMIINQIVPQYDAEGKEIVFDYIALDRMIKKEELNADQVYQQIRLMTDYYRSLISDSVLMREYKRDDQSYTSSINDELKYLFTSVKKQFQDSHREKIANRYAKDFQEIADCFLTNRGRLGKVLTIDEEMLLFLTKLVIKDKEKMRLNNVFNEFQKRGIVLDHLSKEVAADYYERLNLIEKKSDSGDAKYVRSIL